MSSSKLTPRELTYDENGEDFSDIIRRRTNIYINDINDDSDKSSTDDDDEYSEMGTPVRRPKMSVQSPLYRKIQALRLHATPATPKTLLRKATTEAPTHDRFSKPLATGSFAQTPENPTKVFALHNKALQPVMANINPFSPSSFQANKKRLRNSEQYCMIRSSKESMEVDSADDIGTDDEWQAPKRSALLDSDIPRYEKEFVELSLIGEGEFGVVYKCLNRLDGCIYAIKKSIEPVAGNVSEKKVLNEVYAHAVLEKHDNVVRYHSAWAENCHMLIQNEYCNGGSLQSLLKYRSLDESELLSLLAHVADGLRYIHSNYLVHMDLKPGNIFISKTPLCSLAQTRNDGLDDIYEELDMEVKYKIGDMGHVTSIRNPQVEEGDCRYLPNEILQEDFGYLERADIFSLGIMLFEAAGGGPLPKNGQMWHDLREGRVPVLPNISRELNEFIKQLTHPDPCKRPSAADIVNHPLLSPSQRKTKRQLCNELNFERMKNELLIRKLREAQAELESANANPKTIKGIFETYEMSKMER